MDFLFGPFMFGLLVWLVIGLAAGLAMRVLYKASASEKVLTITFGLFGAFIGGMLGTSPYIHHDPMPLRVGGLLGAILGSLFFTFLYHYTARKAI
ncbi:MAG: GlsB/YeaQ/YmgE family stress response membrane protein [Longimicrobiales bacterium]